MKKVLSVLLALCLLAGALPVSASAADSDFTIEKTWVTGYHGPGGDVIIPDGVTAVLDFAFNGCTNVTSITCPKSLTSLSDFAFSGCSGLKTIIIPSVVMYGEYAFPSNVEDIYYGGTEEDWSNNYGYIQVPKNIRVHFNYTGSGAADPPSSTVGGFSDVKTGDYFADAVKWAVENGITSGVGNGRFGPGQTCTRGQIVTFLWNAAGRPEPKSSASPFTDIKSGQYYEKAVLWAVENSITSGRTATSFAPGEPCTRAQAMTFIWNATGRPAPENSSSPFTDVKSGTYYCNAVLWAAENGVTSGKAAATFGTNDPCTRGQIATFLYNWMA